MRRKCDFKKRWYHTWTWMFCRELSGYCHNLQLLFYNFSRKISVDKNLLYVKLSQHFNISSNGMCCLCLLFFWKPWIREKINSNFVKPWEMKNLPWDRKKGCETVWHTVKPWELRGLVTILTSCVYCKSLEIPTYLIYQKIKKI